MNTTSNGPPQLEKGKKGGPALPLSPITVVPTWTGSTAVPFLFSPLRVFYTQAILLQDCLLIPRTGGHWLPFLHPIYLHRCVQWGKGGFPVSALKYLQSHF